MCTAAYHNFSTYITQAHTHNTHTQLFYTSAFAPYSNHLFQNGKIGMKYERMCALTEYEGNNNKAVIKNLKLDRMVSFRARISYFYFMLKISVIFIKKKKKEKNTSKNHTCMNADNNT